ncbi:MAG: TonB-dependent receptor plug domain-containing protein [Oceanicaulis sp.]
MRQVSLIALAAALASAPGYAQENEERPEGDDRQAVELGAVDVVEERAPAPAYGGFDAVDSGLVTVGEESIQRHETGSGDLLDVLRLVPNVRFSVDQFSVRQRDLQDLRPSDISIAGGQTYDNTIRIDGVAVDNVHDTSNGNPFNFNEVAGAAAQTVFLDPSLVSGLEVRDSNVSARYGDFSGGVVDGIIRNPSDEFGATLRFGYESDELVDYVIDPAADLTAADLPPEFVRWRAHGTVDVPVNDRFGLLFGLGRSIAEVDYQLSEGYGGNFRGLRSTSDQFLVKGDYAFSDTLELIGSVIYSPYESEAANANGINNLIVTKGGGLTSKLELAGTTGETDWFVRGSYVFSEQSRRAPQNNFSWDSDAPSIDFCTNRNCSEGGFGDLDQDQQDYTLEAEMTRPLFGGDFSAGAEFSYTDAFKARPEENRAYSRGRYNPNTVCADADDPACIDGEIALPVYFAYLPYEAQVEIAQTSAWVEQLQTFGPVDVRAGLRASRDDYLENTEIAPRLSAVWSITEDWQLTFGANRYYAGDFVGYAIRSQYPDFFAYERDPVVSGTDLIYSVSGWNLDRVTRLAKFRPSDLDTPYSDEATAALTFPLLNGVCRTSTDSMSCAGSKRCSAGIAIKSSRSRASASRRRSTATPSPGRSPSRPTQARPTISACRANGSARGATTP